MSTSHFAARRGGTRLYVLIALLIAIAVPVGWIWTRPPTQPDAAEGQAVAETFLREVREGRPEKAWESTTAEFKSAQGRESFVRHLKDAPFLKNALDFVSTQTVSVQDVPRSEYVFRAGSGETVRLVLNREGSDWKVDRWSPQ